MLNFTGRGRQRQVEKGRGRQSQVEKGKAGRGRQRQAEAGEAVGNVPSLYIPFISYQFCVHLLNWFCVHLYSKVVLCILVQ